MTISNDDFKAAARKTYANLKPAFEVEPKLYFWRLGHAFDTIIDYFLTTDRTDANVFAPIAMRKYEEQGGDWYDDFGWWGIAGLKASSTNLFGGSNVVFRSYALDCWSKMDSNAPYGWERADQVKFNDFKPLFDGGVWNHVVDGGCNPSDVNSLCGRQNTVTNGLYWVLTARLYLDKVVSKIDPLKTRTYLADATLEHQFLEQWFDLTDPDKSLIYHYQADPEKGAVVRERVSTFHSGKMDAGYRPDLAWAGDQGLILGGLVDRMLIVGKTSPEYERLLATARKLLAGTKDYLADKETDKRGILLPWRPDPAPGGDNGDYWTGIAVYMRYLLSAFQNEDLKEDIQQKDYQDFIRANAEYVVEHPNRSQSNDTVVNLTNDLAILVAAIVMLQPGH